MADLIDRQVAIDMFQQLSYDDWNQGVTTSWANAYAECADIISDFPAADAVEVIRCRDCRHSVDEYHDGDCYCHRPNRELEWVGDWDFYCKAAGRRQDG